MFLHIISSDNPQIERVRRTIAASLDRCYTGWSDDFDRMWDSRSLWFCLSKVPNGEYLATCKVIFKHFRGCTNQLPIEVADLERFSVPNKTLTTCEASGLSYVNKTDALHLMYVLGHWLVANSAFPCYAICDEANLLLYRFYTRLCGFDAVPDAFASYSGFRHRDTGLPVRWKVLVLDPASDKALRMLERAGAKMPDLPDACMLEIFEESRQRLVDRSVQLLDHAPLEPVPL